MASDDRPAQGQSYPAARALVVVQPFQRRMGSEFTAPLKVFRHGPDRAGRPTKNLLPVFERRVGRIDALPHSGDNLGRP